MLLWLGVHAVTPVIATLLSTSHGFTHVPAPSESLTLAVSLTSRKPALRLRSRECSSRRTRRYQEHISISLSTLDMAQCDKNVLAILAQLTLLTCKCQCVLCVARGTRRTTAGRPVLSRGYKATQFIIEIVHAP